MDRSRVSTPSSSTAVAAALLLAVVVATTTPAANGYAFGPGLVRHSPNNRSSMRDRSRGSSAVTLYLFPTAPSVSAANHRGRGGRSPSSGGSGGPKTTPTKTTTTTTTPVLSAAAALSDSVLSASDTLASFRTAHGLLSPEVVMRMMDFHENDPSSSPALESFLNLYGTRGPMACLPMLSDPSVLPELTRAMREIV